MSAENEWQKFFDGHAPDYMGNVFTNNTLAEVDFLIDELKLPPGCRILDVGCGTGRHSVELARRGYLMTGVDISAGMLAEAEKAAEESGVKIELIHSNATDFSTSGDYDAALCLCEGSFGLLGTGDDPIEHDLSILRNIYRALKLQARLIVTVLNACRFLRAYTPGPGKKHEFDPVTLCESYTMEAETPEGKQSLSVRERSYVPSELTMLFRMAGFDVENIWGGTAGNWGRRPLDVDEMEIMAVSRKNSSAGD